MLATKEVDERRTRREIGRGVGGGGPRICIQLIQIYNRLYIRVASILFSGVARLVADTSATYYEELKANIGTFVGSKQGGSRTGTTIKAKLGTSRLV